MEQMGPCSTQKMPCRKQQPWDAGAYTMGSIQGSHAIYAFRIATHVRIVLRYCDRTWGTVRTVLMWFDALLDCVDPWQFQRLFLQFAAHWAKHLAGALQVVYTSSPYSLGLVTSEWMQIWLTSRLIFNWISRQHFFPHWVPWSSTCGVIPRSEVDHVKVYHFSLGMLPAKSHKRT